MINIKTYLRQYKNDTAGIVWISFYVQRQKVNFSTKVAVSLKNWNDKKGIVTSGDKQAADKNLIIETILARINNVFVKYRLRDKKLSRDLFLREYNRPSDYPTFFDFVREHMKKISHRTELTTLQTHMSVMRKIKDFNANLTFDDITHEWLDVYFAHLRKGLENNANYGAQNETYIED